MLDALSAPDIMGQIVAAPVNLPIGLQSNSRIVSLSNIPRHRCATELARLYETNKASGGVWQTASEGCSLVV